MDMGGLWHCDYVCELLADILRICCMVSFEFFPRCVVAVSDVDVSCVVSVAEDVELYGG
jgi:hypothetical protein